MDKAMHSEFEEWFNLFEKQLRNHNYKGPLKEDYSVMEIVNDLYELGETPEQAADEFYLEENRQD